LKKKLSLVLLIIFCFSLGGYFSRDVLKDAWAAIQSQVGTNVQNNTLGSSNIGAWVPLTQIITNSDGILDNVPFTPGTSISSAILDTQSIVYGFNGATFDRIRSGISVDTAPNTGLLNNGSMIFNGTTWERRRSANQVFPITLAGVPFNALGLIDSTSLNFQPLTSIGAAPDGSAGTRSMAVGSHIYNGTTFDRVRSASTTNLTTSPLVGAVLTVPASNVSCTSTPAAGAQATCTLAAGAGTVRHVATSITACIINNETAAGTSVLINLRDGASGAGTVLWSSYLGAGVIVGSTSPQQNSKCITLSGLSITGSATTAMTLESSSAPTANSQVTVTLTALNVQ
jgi:hypothetical protein